MLSLLYLSRNRATSLKIKQVWKIKRDGRCLVICASIITKVEEKWYFNSGSSRHMTDNREFFINL